MNNIHSKRSIILYEPRMLHRNAVCSCLEAQGYQVKIINDINADDIMLATDSESEPVIVGIGGAGADFFMVLHWIYRLVERSVKTAVLLHEYDTLLARMMNELGVSSLLCEPFLQQELKQFLELPLYRSTSFPGPVRHFSNEIKRYLSLNELNYLTEFARGMTAHEIAAHRQVNYKTVYAHKRNIRLRLELMKTEDWLALLSRIEKLYRTGGRLPDVYV